MTLNIKNIVFTCILLSLATNEVKGSKYLLIDLKDEDLPTIKPEAEAPILRVTPSGVLANDSKTSGIQRSFDSASQKKRLSSGYQSPLDRWFCESVSSDVSKVYDVCVSKCEEATGWYSRCTETVFEKRCGCKQGRPRKKGVMTYENGYLENTKINSQACDRIKDLCRRCRWGRNENSRQEAYVGYKDNTCDPANERCGLFDPGEYWRYTDGSSFRGVLDDYRCRSKWHLQGNAERFCQVKCANDGSCTETVKQTSCSCPPDYDDYDFDSEAKEHCATVEYQDGNKIAVHGDMGGHDEGDMFSVCDTYSGFRCIDCRKDDPDMFKNIGTYNMYAYEDEYCPLYYSRRSGSMKRKAILENNPPKE